MGNSTKVSSVAGSFAAVLLVAALAGCGGADPQPGNTVSPTAPPSTSSSTTPGQETDVRTQLANGLREISPTTARLVERPETKLTEVSTPWLTDWQVYDVLNLTPPHPQRFYAALSADGTVQYLTGKPEAFSAVTTGAGLETNSAKTAVSVAEVFLDTTQDFLKASYRVSAVDDIQWLPKPTADDAKSKASVEKQFADKVEPPAAKKSGSGWTVTAWMVYGRRLDKHAVTIGGDGAVSDKVVHAYDGLPVPDSF